MDPKKLRDVTEDPWDALKRGADLSYMGDSLEYQQQVREDRPDQDKKEE